MLPSVFITLFITVFAFNFPANADLSIPLNLSAADRETALEILGYGTAGKPTSNPYPLGGYLGVEAGLAFERVGLDNLDTLGAGASDQNELIFPTFSFGKGLYGNIDLYFYFTPFLESISLSRYGGFLRWAFYRAQEWPTSLSLVVHGGSANIDNKISTETYSYSLVGSFQYWDISFYAGIGKMIAHGQFVGGAAGITDTGSTEKAKIEELTTQYGISYYWDPYTVTAEINHTHGTTMSLKLGFIF